MTEGTQVKRQQKCQWVYRPTEKEHEALLRALEANPEYPSISQFIREGVIRLITAEDRRPLFTELSDTIDEFHSLKERFLTLVLRNEER